MKDEYVLCRHIFRHREIYGGIVDWEPIQYKDIILQVKETHVGILRPIIPTTGFWQGGIITINSLI